MIRHATEQDLPQILAIYNHAIEHTTAIFEYQPHTLEMRRAWFRAKQDSLYPVFVAVESDRVLGFASYGPFRAWPAYQYSIELSVYVDVDARRRGIATELIRTIVEDAQRQGMHAVMAGITSDNEISLRLHERLGFREVADIPQVGYKFGKWLDLKLLQLLLETPAHPRDGLASWDGYVLAPFRAGGDPAFDLGTPDWLNRFDHVRIRDSEFNELERAGFWKHLFDGSQVIIDVREEEWVDEAKIAAFAKSLETFPADTLSIHARWAIERIQSLCAVARERKVPLIFVL